ncbi:MAG: YbjQ family protein [Planctomycetes bacterium]|nr:YbjQ family protein [Planctomycetota bacterium]
MIVTTTDTVPGHATVRVMGIARGTAIRTRHLGHSMIAWIGALFGGEVPDYTKVIAEARDQAYDRMVEDARSKGANAILGVRFCSIEVMRNAAEILAYGTAAVVEDGAGRGVGAR